jgi:hypothetical protein
MKLDRGRKAVGMFHNNFKLNWSGVTPKLYLLSFLFLYFKKLSAFQQGKFVEKTLNMDLFIFCVFSIAFLLNLLYAL